MRYKQGVIFNGTFFPYDEKYASILEELKNMAEYNSENEFEEIEIFPNSHYDLFTPVNTWKIREKSNPFSECLITDYPYKYNAIKEWAEKYIHSEKINLTLTKGTHYIKNCFVTAVTGEVEVKAFGNSEVTAYRGS